MSSPGPTPNPGSRPLPPGRRLAATSPVPGGTVLRSEPPRSGRRLVRRALASIGLGEADQDAVVAALDEDTATGFERPSARGFFSQLRNDTIEGVFADMMYGGNRDLVGWKLIGDPAAQRYYSVADRKGSGTPRSPQGLAQLVTVEGH